MGEAEEEVGGGNARQGSAQCKSADMETERVVSNSLQIHHPERKEHPQAETEADQPGNLQEEQQKVHPEQEEHEGEFPEQSQCHQ